MLSHHTDGIPQGLQVFRGQADLQTGDRQAGRRVGALGWSQGGSTGLVTGVGAPGCSRGGSTRLVAGWEHRAAEWEHWPWLQKK